MRTNHIIFSGLGTFLGLVGLVSAAVPLYGQCGGIGYAGETTCVAGAVCVYSNDYYSQCLAVSATGFEPESKLILVKGTATITATTKGITTSKTTASTTTTTSKTTTSTASAPSGSIPAGAITVGSGGKYSTIAAALKDTSSNVYYIYAGTYKEQILISRANVKIYGQTSSALDYTANTVTITNNIPASQAGSNDASGTVRVSATGVSLYNLNIANTYGKPVDQSQAIALSVQAGTFGAYACKLTGYQDTLLANKGTQFYGRTYINGATDFNYLLEVCYTDIFCTVGMEASIWITKSTIETIASGYITASGRSTADANYYVIDNSTIYAEPLVSKIKGSNVVAAGWKVWSTDDPRTGHVYYGEYANTGSGAWQSGRVSFATKMTAGVSITTVLGSTSWIDPAYM
ncbi:hypothetical protein FRC12_002592 [Ceratobasidium sp. 428]|nr:hypothetical protein FRC12_002592 [Ceratobasidium sp. 428]